MAGSALKGALNFEYPLPMVAVATSRIFAATSGCVRFWQSGDIPQSATESYQSPLQQTQYASQA